MNSLVNAIIEKLGETDEARERIGSAVLFIALSAFGEALIGPPLRAMLDQPDDAGRKVVASLLPRFIKKPTPEA